PGHAREFMGIILKNARRVSRLTEDLLALAQVESGQHKLKMQPVRASALVRDAIESLAGMVLESGMSLEAGELTDMYALADVDALEQIFGNLVENAMKYGAGGKRIVLGARPLEHTVEFYVQDFGQGIAMEHLGRIFERFYRVDKARSRESGGTGLGLAIVKHIILAHGGSIRVESELGAGATFLFTLPAAPEAMVAGETRAAVAG
ncbi:MAG TPA: ATP-binding protein, partial [Acidobacteriaceae bacterium]|nr:ATP-binding protein [Acidobacteriaceae bacterium]